MGASPLDPPIFTNPGQRHNWIGLHGSASALAVATAASKHDGFSLVVTDTTSSAYRWLDELRAFADPDLDVLHFPDWETLPYDAFSPHQDIVSERVRTLMRLPRLRRALLVLPLQTLLQRLPPRQYLESQRLQLAVGDRFDLNAERIRLDTAGYLAVDTVTGHGEYAVRGALVDIFPMGSPWPIRVDLLDEEIDSLRQFDPDTQRTVDRIERIDLLPAKEFPLTEPGIRGFRQRWHETFDADVRRCSVYQDVSQGIAPSGVEYYLPLFFEQMNTLFEYLPTAGVLYSNCDLAQVGEDLWQDIRDRHESLRHDIERPILPPETLFLRVEELGARLKDFARVQLGPGSHEVAFDCKPLPDLHLQPHSRTPEAPLGRWLQQVGYPSHAEPQAHALPLLFVAESAGRREVLDDFLQRAGFRTQPVADPRAYLTERRQGWAAITVAPLGAGFLLPDLAVITEFDLFGSQPGERRRQSNRVQDPEQIVRNLAELHIGAPVVHLEHGVGRYLGLETLPIDGAEQEFLALAYADGAKLYVPVTALHLISRYAGVDETHAPLHRLGSDQWERARRKAAEKAYDVAAELLDVYAKRELHPAQAFAHPGSDYALFASAFPFDTTPDQERAIEEVIGDLCTDKVTDRLICGDVGFGKTEVAMRAAFVTVQAGKQVVVLVPTTLLATQHFETFRDRFASWPVNIEVASRMRTDRDIQEIQNQLHSGKIDILIGTHKLLGKGFNYRDLGLVIIDEEHRFGVRQKERLKALRAEVDVITLTATPIPRTLNLAMSGLRDLSIIATPPAKRLAIKTFVHESRLHVTKEAITRELMRGGQVFYVHNEVKDIDAVAARLQELIPEARIGVGHGQMHKRDLERVMNEFYHRQLNVLVCTTIIENGIDVPNANTIIIDRADRFGLAQLHQLRGRVGRSNRQAYAYLLTPHPKAVTADARKRLEALQAAGDLGIGFTLATHDLEIRGAGELLGEEQSGQIESVGFSLYMELLDRAVRTLKAGREPDLDLALEPGNREVNLHAPALIPADYLPDVHGRLIFYKRIASVADSTELDNLKAEMVDRFGPFPESLKRLFQVTALRLRLSPLGIGRLDLADRGGRLEFAADTAIDPMALVNLVQSAPQTYRMDGGSVLRITEELPAFEARLAFAERLLDSFSAPAGKPSDIRTARA